MFNRNMAIILFILIIFMSGGHHIGILIVHGIDFDWSMGKTSVLLSAISYCSDDTLREFQFRGDAESFNLTKIIHATPHDIHGFIGYRPLDKKIYVVFRGTHTPLNIKDDIEFVLTEYPECVGCKVHEGFYHAKETIISEVLSEIIRLTSLLSSYQIIVTGHSLGAAVATLIGVDLIQKNISLSSQLTLITFGCPRVGNRNTAIFLSSLYSPEHRFRVTHMRDPVPHLPFPIQGYMHMAGEWYYDDVNIRACEGYEDKTCSQKWRIWYITDHLYYLNVILTCNQHWLPTEMEL
mmetsp:Transcript_33327/g.33938  ORF Transcript_33327/g.33938 Transcript_33327/m.33938 type:complete len:293 (+) Transcript_33327:66-944(+)